jgi:RNA polymerase sigma-70 factor (ECF subfamily)
MHHVPRLQRAARSILGRDDLAADAVQEALITAHEIREPPRNLEAWLLRTVTHRSLAARRAHARRLRHERSASELLAQSVTHLDPERELVRKELATEIATALHALPGEQREAFLLREMYGLDYDQISSAQRVPIGTVRSRLSRARRGLRARLGRLASPALQRAGAA